MKVLCCCNPSNEIGEAPDGLAFPTREWEDEDGNTGVAYPSHGVAWDLQPGFVRTVARKGTKKTWRKTWREK